MYPTFFWITFGRVQKNIRPHVPREKNRCTKKRHMTEDLNILPPDKELFHEREKKPCSLKQKLHLEKARVAARETIERRRRLDQEAKAAAAKEEEEESEEEEVPVKRKGILKQKAEVVLTEEEEEARHYAKFMKSMNRYEKHKALKLQELEESKKIHMSFTPEQHAHIKAMLEREQESFKTKQALAKASPVAPKESEPVNPQIRRLLNKGSKVSRFGL